MKNQDHKNYVAYFWIGGAMLKLSGTAVDRKEVEKRIKIMNPNATKISIVFHNGSK